VNRIRERLNQGITVTTPSVRDALQLAAQSRRKSQKFREALIETSLLCCGLLSIGVTLAIAGILIFGSFEFFVKHDGRAMTGAEIWDRVSYFFTGTEWTAGFSDAKYGILPLLIGTLTVAVIAAAIALPIGLTTAIYLSEYSSPRTRAIAKPILELLAGIPTVVYGFFAITVITPALAPLFAAIGLDLGNPNNQISGGIVVGIMIIPMVASLSEDALRAVPRSLRDGAIALGATKYETSVKVVVPAALSGITASFLLALSRAIGETMAVSLACGDTARIVWPTQGMATMTSFIVRIAKGDVQHGSTDFNSLFAVGGALFAMTLVMNVLAQRIMKRYRLVYK
jgi:phosphate transport system permease protein